MSDRKTAGLIFFASVLLSVIFWILFAQHKSFFEDAQGLGLAGIFLVNLIGSASFSFATPGFLTVIAGGSIYPIFLVALFSSLGAALGDLVSFAMGFSGRKLINHKLEKKAWFIVLEKVFKKHSIWVLFLFSIIPNPAFDVIGIIAGIFAYSPLRYFLIVFAGRFLRFLLLAKFGSYLW